MCSTTFTEGGSLKGSTLQRELRWIPKANHSSKRVGSIELEKAMGGLAVKGE
jgi:hypothetical protein